MWKASSENNANTDGDDFYSEDLLLPVSVTAAPPQRHTPRHDDEIPTIDVNMVFGSEHVRVQDENQTDVHGDFVVTSQTDVGLTTDNEIQAGYDKLTTPQPHLSVSVEVNENPTQLDSTVTQREEQSTDYSDLNNPFPTLIVTQAHFNPEETTRASDVSKMGQTLSPASEDPALSPPLQNSGDLQASGGTIGNEFFDPANQTSPATTEDKLELGVQEISTTGPTSKGIWPSSHFTQATSEAFSNPTSTVVAPTADMWSVPAPTSTLHVTAHWVTGSWSVCSTTCGLGAVWRTLACSTGSELDCDPAKRPSPAQRCYLRPCSMWKVAEWSKCSKNCGIGMKSREVHCFDMRDQRPLRPFHCRAISLRPLSHMMCNPQPCLDWYTSSWGQCSEVCGGGEQQRVVTCLEEGRCNNDLQPMNFQPCNNHPCAEWLTGAWEKCSASCGGGVQHRLIKCVNSRTQTEEVDPTRCQQELKPKITQKCNTNACKSKAPRAACPRDRLTLRFCRTLRTLGRCQLSNVQAQCCRTCHRTSNKDGEVGHLQAEEER